MAVERIVNVLETGTGARVGRPPRGIQLLSALEVVSVSQGSFVLNLNLRRPQPLLPEFDIGETAVEKLVAGLPAITAEVNGLPEGFDDGVLTVLREAGRVFDRGIDSASLSLARLPCQTVFTSQTRDSVVSRIRRSQQSWVSAEGRLLMADVEEGTLRCRLHTSMGQRIHCTFPEHLASTIMTHMRRFVSVRGEATLEPSTDQVRSIRVLDVEAIDEPTSDGPVAPSSFWEAKHFDSLALEQGVYPIDDISRLQGDWPESADFDSFLAAIQSARGR